MLDGIEFVVVALGAADGEAEPDGAGGGDAIEDAVDAELFFVDAAFLVDLGVAMEAGGDFLAFGGVGQEVAGELLDGELVEGHVGVEGVDDPVAEFPDLAGGVDGIAVAVGVAGLVEPPAAPAFAVVGALEEAVDEFGVGLVGGVGEEGGDFFRGRGEAGEVERDAADEGGG